MNLKISAALVTALLAAFGLLFPTPPVDPIEAARLNNLGCAYMNQQLFEKGLNEFQKALQADPKFSIARLNEGVAYMNLQKVDEAKAALDDALKHDPRNPTAWYNLGLLAKNMGDAHAAIEDLKHVTEIDPADADTWYFLGTAYVQAKQFPQAIEAFQHALQLNPLHASAEFGLSRAYQQSSDVNKAREHLKKFQYITQNKIGAPMSLAYGEQGKYSRAVESTQAVLKAPAQIKVHFVDVTQEAGLSSASVPDVPDTLGTGACFLDYDNDGKMDLFLPDNGVQGMSLFHNVGGAKFENVTAKAGIDVSVHGIGCTAGDYDNDGFSDLAVTSRDAVILLHNEHNGTFKDVAASAGIKGVCCPAGVTFVDYDHDGDLDLYVASRSGSISQHETGNSRMWRNNGDGTFNDITEERGLSGNFRANGAIGTDYNNDRAVDLLVTSSMPEILENPREGKFKERRLWPDPVRMSPTGVSILDFDHDGWMDV